MIYDVVVVGLGPAGSSAALYAASRGMRVLALERRRWPRYKTCGGAVSGFAVNELGLDLHEVTEARLERVQVSLRVGDEYIQSDPGCVIAYFTLRDKLDAYLADLAREAGAELRFEESFVGFELRDGVVHIDTSQGSYKARYLIAADGAHSEVRRMCPVRTTRPLAFGMEVEAPTAPRWKGWHGQALVRYGGVPYGYAWVFPKWDLLSIGVGTSLPRHHKLLRAHLDRFLTDLGIDASNLRIKGHPIPTWVDVELGWEQVLFTGDAAYLVDGLSGEGIGPALLSGKAAVAALLSVEGTGESTLTDRYAANLSDLLHRLRISQLVAGEIYAAQRLFRWFIRRRPDVIDLYFRIVGGIEQPDKLLGLLRRPK